MLQRSLLQIHLIETLKLDGSFVCEITSDPDRPVIAEAIVSMAHRASNAGP